MGPMPRTTSKVDSRTNIPCSPEAFDRGPLPVAARRLHPANFPRCQEYTGRVPEFPPPTPRTKGFRASPLGGFEGKGFYLSRYYRKLRPRPRPIEL